jgi:hypothetical protein
MYEIWWNEIEINGPLTKLNASFIDAGKDDEEFAKFYHQKRLDLWGIGLIGEYDPD